MASSHKCRSSAHKAAALVGVAACLHAMRFMVKEKGHSKMGLGAVKVQHWLRAKGSAGRDMLGMTTPAFLELEKVLKRTNQLVPGRYISVRESIAIFLYMARFGATCRRTADVFGHSAASIGRALKCIVRALISPDMYGKHVYMAGSQPAISDRIISDPALFPFFKDVFGAIDGSHVPAHAPLEIRDRFWNRKGWTLFNVLAPCDFDMCFIYVLSGWEGSTSDSFLWRQAAESGLDFCGHRLLGDAGFPFSPHLLIPYRGVRYHLKEYFSGAKRPRNQKELYNRRHAGARSVVERVFDVLQARFKILTIGCHLDMQIQADVFPALAVVHNLIRRFDPDNDIDIPVITASSTADLEEEENPSSTQGAESAEVRNAQAHRDRVARRMWTRYARQ